MCIIYIHYISLISARVQDTYMYTYIVMCIIYTCYTSLISARTKNTLFQAEKKFNTKNSVITKFLEGLKEEVRGCPRLLSSRAHTHYCQNTVCILQQTSVDCNCHMTKPKLPINNHIPVTLLTSINSRKIAYISLSLSKFHRNAHDWQN